MMPGILSVAQMVNLGVNSNNKYQISVRFLCYLSMVIGFYITFTLPFFSKQFLDRAGNYFIIFSIIINLIFFFITLSTAWLYYKHRYIFIGLVIIIILSIIAFFVYLIVINWKWSCTRLNLFRIDIC